MIQTTYTHQGKQHDVIIGRELGSSIRFRWAYLFDPDGARVDSLQFRTAECRVVNCTSKASYPSLAEVIQAALDHQSADIPT